jgi:ribonuclease BN (tRNA processing enzyme)
MAAPLAEVRHGDGMMTESRQSVTQTESGPLRVVFLGSGDAFGSGGRGHACVHVTGAAASFLVDCGASALPAMRRLDVDPNDVELVLLSHLHGDHFGGLPFLLLDAQLPSRRARPLTIAGPVGTAERVRQATEVMFPGAWRESWRFPLEIVELKPGRRAGFGAVSVTPHVVSHPSGAPPLALRVEVGGRVLAFSGDTEWTPELVSVAEGADLFVVESYTFERPVPYHLDYGTLIRHVPELRAKRLVLTHMSAEMLDRVAGLDCEYADDGKQIEL